MQRVNAGHAARAKLSPCRRRCLSASRPSCGGLDLTSDFALGEGAGDADDAVRVVGKPQVELRDVLLHDALALRAEVVEVDRRLGDAGRALDVVTMLARGPPSKLAQMHAPSISSRTAATCSASSATSGLCRSGRSSSRRRPARTCRAPRAPSRAARASDSFCREIRHRPRSVTDNRHNIVLTGAGMRLRGNAWNVANIIRPSPTPTAGVDRQLEAPIGSARLTLCRLSDIALLDGSHKRSRHGRQQAGGAEIKDPCGSPNTRRGVTHLGFRNQHAACHRAGMTQRRTRTAADRRAASGRWSAGKVEGERIAVGTRWRPAGLASGRVGGGRRGRGSAERRAGPRSWR